MESIQNVDFQMEIECKKIPSSTSRFVNQQSTESVLCYLPREIILSVFFFLPPKDLAKSAQVCREWRIMSSDEILWKNLCFNSIGNFFKTMQPEGKSWKEIFIHYALHPKFISYNQSTLQILDNGIGIKVKCEGWPGYKTALTSSCANTGVHFWRVQLRPKLLGWLAIIGVINEDLLKESVDTNTPIDEISGSFGYFYDGKVVHYTNGSRSITHGCGYGPGDIIMILLDMDKCRLSYHLCSFNSKKITHVCTFDNIQRGKYRLAVSLNYQDTEVILLENIPPPFEIIPLETRSHYINQTQQF